MHPSDELPLTFEFSDYCQFNYGMLLDILITPEIIETELELKKFPVEVRRCLFEDEHKMQFFKKYSVKNCEAECISKLSLRNCSCVPFDIIRDNNTRVCDSADTYCANNVAARVRKNLDESIRDECNCMPSCNKINYKVSYVESRFDDNKNGSADEITIRIKFKDNEFTPMKRFQQFTTVDFLAQSAGLLGLYTGFSVLSLVELFYLFSLRAMIDQIRRFALRNKIRPL